MDNGPADIQVTAARTARGCAPGAGGTHYETGISCGEAREQRGREWVRGRDGEGGIERERERESVCVCVCV